MGERTPSSIVSKRLTFFPESRCLRQGNRTQENTGLFLRKADRLLFGNTRKEAPLMVLFCSSTSRDTDNNDRNGICPPPEEIRVNVFIFPIRAAHTPRRIPGGSFHIPDRPLRPATFPHRAVPRRTAPSHAGPYPHFASFFDRLTGFFQFRPIPTEAIPSFPIPPTGRPAENAGNEGTIRPCDK